jgi:hypothetical protein
MHPSLTRVNRAPAAVRPIGEWAPQLHYSFTSRIPICTRWLSVEKVYAFAGAVTKSQKRTVRRHLQALHGHGVGKDRSGHWMAAEVIAAVASRAFRDRAIARRAPNDATLRGGQFAAPTSSAIVPRLRSAPGQGKRTA